MQSTGQGGRQSSQPVHSAAMIVCMRLARADDRVDRTRLDAFRAADADRFVDRRRRAAALRCHWRDRAVSAARAEQVGKRFNAVRAAGWAVVDVGFVALRSHRRTRGTSDSRSACIAFAAAARRCARRVSLFISRQSSSAPAARAGSCARRSAIESATCSSAASSRASSSSIFVFPDAEKLSRRAPSLSGEISGARSRTTLTLP